MKNGIQRAFSSDPRVHEKRSGGEALRQQLIANGQLKPTNYAIEQEWLFSRCRMPLIRAGRLVPHHCIGEHHKQLLGKEVL